MAIDLKLVYVPIFERWNRLKDKQFQSNFNSHCTTKSKNPVERQDFEQAEKRN